MTRLLTTIGQSGVTAVAALALLLTGASLLQAQPAPVDPELGHCTPSAVTYISGYNRHSTSSANYVAVPDASIPFTQGGHKGSCVIVNFTAQASGNSTGASMVVRATLDGTFLPLNADVYFAGGDFHYRGQAATFIFPRVAPGLHRLRILYLSASDSAGNNDVSLRGTQVVIHHTP